MSTERIHLNAGIRPKTDGDKIRAVSQKLLELFDASPGGVQRDLERIAKRLDKMDLKPKGQK